MKIAARIAFGGSLLTVALLLLLHILSPEFDPSWRMVSEYADGNYGWVLSLMFMAWAISSWALAYALSSRLKKTKAGKVGLAFLILAGIGEAMAAVFDVNHSLHDVAGNIGIISLPIAALLINRALGGKFKALTHATWISVVLLVVSFIVLMSTYMSSGGDVNAGNEITTLPDGVVAFVGWTNRLLIITYAAWVAAVSWRSIK